MRLWHPAAGIVAVLVFMLCPPARAGDDLAERFDPFGDFRYRSELTTNPDAPDRYRPRVRVRFGAFVDVGHGMRIEVRAVTGDPTDPRTSHQTLGLGGGKFSFNLDRINLQWRPQQVAGLRLVGGKFAMPVRPPVVYSDLVQDTDVMPTGVVAAYRRGEGTGVDAVVGNYVLDERSTGQETWATVAQLGLRLGRVDDVQVRVYGDAFILVVGDGTTVDRLGHPTGRGNLVQNNQFVSDFHVLHGYVEVEARLGGQPMVVSAGAVHNLEAYQNENDSGWYLGASAGRLSGWGTVRARAQYQWLQQEAVFTPWAGDDLPDDRGSRFEAVAFQVGLGLTSRTDVQATLLSSTLLDPGPTESDAWLARYRIDFNVSF